MVERQPQALARGLQGCNSRQGFQTGTQMRLRTSLKALSALLNRRSREETGSGQMLQQFAAMFTAIIGKDSRSFFTHDRLEMNRTPPDGL